jgi:xanthine dehydrogenase YagR molybdenum-binding subunit
MSFGAHFCEVRVNRWTGEPKVSRLLCVVDAGTIVNAKTARSQIMGGMIMGVGQALMEGTVVEPTGRFANTNLASYLVPVNADIPPIDVVFVIHPDTVFGASASSASSAWQPRSPTRSTTRPAGASETCR